MREKVEDMAGLAAALREAAAENETWRGSLLSVANAISKPEPAVHWIGPFEHHGGKCPLPPQTVVRVTTRDGVSTDHGLEVRAWDWAWDNGGEENDSDIVSFSYAADNPKGWIKRPKGWVPPPPDFSAGDAEPADTRAEAFQARVFDWLLVCFGEAIARDTTERNRRFLEEALELVQSLGCTQSEARQLVDYVFDRPPGEPTQETGAVMVTLAALCEAAGIDMAEAGEAEIARVWGKIDVIRAKQAAKPQHSPLPAAAAPIPADVRDVVREALEECSLCFNRESGLSKKIREALAALDAAPTEKVVGYGVLADGLGLSFRATRAEADTTAAIMRGAGRGEFRIVRLVAEDE